MVHLIKRFFHRPTVTKNCLSHIRKCDTCQRMDKSNPRRNEMQVREMTTIPFEWVEIYLVGPFPTTVGGHKFMLTSIDLATRYPSGQLLPKSL